MNTDKLEISWQNFARVRLQLKFAFIIWPLIPILLSSSYITSEDLTENRTQNLCCAALCIISTR